jgi:glucose/arabinose dehydrogenase/azurin
MVKAFDFAAPAGCCLINFQKRLQGMTDYTRQAIVQLLPIRKMTRAAILLLYFLLLQWSRVAAQTFQPEKGAHLILLGNTFADRMRHYGYFETLLQKSFPNRHLTLRNMGWSADEVGLQPRPLNFPGFKNSDAVVSEVTQEVAFKRYKFEGEKIVMPVALNFAGLHQDLAEQRADIIFLCFGMNESFKGPAGLAQFEKDLLVFMLALREQRYNGKSAPQLILVSPIAHEDKGPYYPNPDTHNQNLQLYTTAMQRVASEQGVLFIDLFTPSLKRMLANPNVPLTINGIHLTEKGYSEAARWMADGLGFGKKSKGVNFTGRNAMRLREVVKMKDDHFFYRWRAVNGEYIYGRRREPFGVLSFPPELKKLTEMTSRLDEVIWQLAKGSGEVGYKKALEIIDERGKPAPTMNVPDVVMTGRQGAAHTMDGHDTHTPKIWPATTDQFTLPLGFEINLFASEKNFPIEKPVAMNFDAKGRLWVATMPTYPQYFPGIPVHDRIVILEDTNGDGVADKHTVFADNLYLPLGFEFYDGGVIVSQEPDLLFLKDTDGDDKADIREIILTGFGSEDSHHATHAFTFGQDGALYFNEGTFLNTQVETPYGPIRSYSGATYRFEPRTGKLQHYISYPYFNPWGSVFDKWGTHLIGDASDGSNYFAPPMTGKIDYPQKHPRINMFTTTRVRPTAGIEIISSRQFPDAVQGNFLVNNNIGFQGTKQHQVLASGSGITSREVVPLLQSSDPNFRPIDLKFGPDGALYIVDWYNPLVSHGENPPRDPMRDKLHGRIWRIRYKDKPLLPITDLSGQPVPQLLDNLKGYEDRFRYRTRARIREMPVQTVIPELPKWMKLLDKNDPQYEHHLLEALWLYQDFGVPEPDLLKTLLSAKDYRARIAAVKVLLQWRDRIPGALELMGNAVNDESARVRLEAIVALSHFEGKNAWITALDIFKHPTDYYLDYAINETFSYLKQQWLAELRQSENIVRQHPMAATYLLNRLTDHELMGLPRSEAMLDALISRNSVEKSVKSRAILDLASQTEKKPVEMILERLRSESSKGKSFRDLLSGQKELIAILLTMDQSQLQNSKSHIIKCLEKGEPASLQAVAFAALITADGSDKSARKLADRNPGTKSSYLNGISILQDPVLQNLFYAEVKEQALKIPADSVNNVAFRVLSELSGHDADRIQTIVNLIQHDAPYTALAVDIISSKSDKVLQSVYAQVSVDRILGYIRETPANQRSTPLFNRVITLGKRLAALLPEAGSVKALSILDQAGILEVKLSALPAKMLFDLDRIQVSAGRAVSILFDNPDLMPHNVVIVKPGSLETVGKAADAMARLKDGFERNFVPDLPEVLFFTPLVNSGQSYRLNFTAPDTPGDYPFICSFPGHWQVMKGVLKVE